MQENVALHRRRGASAGILRPSVAAGFAETLGPNLLAVLYVARLHEFVVGALVAQEIEAVADNGGSGETEIDVGDLPELLRSFFRPLFEQAGFLRNAVALRPTPLRPIGGGDGESHKTDYAGGQNQQPCFHPAPCNEWAHEWGGRDMIGEGRRGVNHKGCSGGCVNSSMKTKAPTSDRPTNERMVERRPDLWQLIWGQPYIDAARLAQAIELDLKDAPAPDFRSRLLVRDAAKALRSFWRSKRFELWLGASAVGESIRRILSEDLGETGYPFIRRRLAASIDAVKIKRIFDLLGRAIHGRIEVNIAGSIPTLIQGMTAGAVKG